MTGPTNTRVDYMYRDASNYKQHGHVVLAGAITPGQEAVVRGALEGAELFIAGQVGLPNLRDDWETHYEDDHVWHELAGFEPTAQRPTGGGRTVEDLVEAFRDVVWDVPGATVALEAWKADTPAGR